MARVTTDRSRGAEVLHRRLIALMGVMAFPLLGLAGVLLWSTGTRAASARAEAEAKLLRATPVSTTRGRILDRKGRVLAQDRPSFDVAVDYRAISGAWAASEARRFARALNRAQWTELSEAQRAALVERCLPAFRAHAESAWDTLAAATGLTPGEIRARRDQVVQEVGRRREAVLRQRRERELQALLPAGGEPTPEQRAAIERRIDQPISDEESAHVVAPRAGDDVALACLALASREVTIAPLGEDDAAVRLAGGEASRSNLRRSVPAVPGLVVRDAGDREYPLDSMDVAVDLSTLPGPLKQEGVRTLTVEGVGAHLVGWMRTRVFREDQERRERELAADAALADRSRVAMGEGTLDRGEYREGDRVGGSGLESSSETALRGLRGLRVTALDTGLERTIAPEPGVDLTLTIDAVLQARVQAAMSPELGLAVVQPWHGPPNDLMPTGTALNGAAVVLDVDSGHVLAAVSTPELSRRTLRDQPELVFDDTLNQPALNRCLERPYPPGSIVKPLVLAWAARTGAFRPDERIACSGHLLPDRPDMLRCWIYKRNGITHNDQLGEDLNAPEGVMVSCNIMFFTLGRRLGPRGIAEAYRAFGVGETWGLGVGAEYAGAIGPPPTPGASRGDPIGTGDAIQMGIGQGPIAWTPLHAADAYATLVRGGVRVRPTLVKRSEARADPPSASIPSWAVDQAMEGLRLAVSDERGTGHHLTFEGGVREPIFNTPGVTVWGKTGTASARRAVGELDGENTGAGVADMDHSWFVVLVGREGDRPRYAVAVLMEYAGSGGKVSGPIVNQIIRALAAEGYL